MNPSSFSPPAPPGSSPLPTAGPADPGRKRKRWWRLAGVTGIALVLGTGCCATGPRAVQPSFAGVPQAIVRSVDYPLPLSAAHREDLLKFLAADGNRFQMVADPPDDVTLDRARADYGALLDELARRAPTPADLRPGAGFGARFDDGLTPMAIHDARIGWAGEPRQLVAVPAADLTGMVKGKYVFAFYARRLASPTGNPAAPTDSWSLGPRAGDGAFTGLVVFHRNYAIPEPLR